MSDQTSELHRMMKMDFSGQDGVTLVHLELLSKSQIYSVFHGIGNQEQGCCELVLGFQKAQGASL